MEKAKKYYQGRISGKNTVEVLVGNYVSPASKNTEAGVLRDNKQSRSYTARGHSEASNGYDDDGSHSANYYTT